MPLSSISTSSAYPYKDQVAHAFRQREQDFTRLGHALQSGDLAGAQQAFAALKKDTQTIQHAQQLRSLPSGQNARGSRNFKEIESALNSGDLSGAQKAFAIVQQDIQAVRRSHGSLGYQTPAVAQNDDDGARGSDSSIQSIGTKTDQSA